MGTGPKQQWGGKRPGSGKKPFTERERMREKLLSRAELWEKKLGIPFFDSLFAICYGETLDGIKIPKIADRSRVLAAKTLIDAMIRKEEEGSQVPKDERPRVWLPERKPDPAKEKIAEA